MLSSADIREAFLRFFESKGHTRVVSSSLIPANDPTLLFTNAGMNQFKDCFLGLDKRHYTRAVSSQKCVRAGGKHNDLENVGYTARHHTFFEMLGNFSFGDYFKRDAIAYAWEFLTSPAWLNIPQDKLWVTVYATDDEAFQLWQDVAGVPAERIIRIGDNKGAPYASDNFWAMGDTGPCGPCTEIFYDHGADIWGGLPGSAEEDGDRYIEIWNNVFMQFNRTADGVLHPLPAPSVDTGMGLERISAVMQHVHSNYEIDLFQHLLQAAADAIACPNQQQASLKVVADHARSCSFLIADGVIPSNEGRGYVLRRIIRRACRHGNKLGATQPFFYKMVAALAQVMGAAYPELVERQAFIQNVLKQEEEQFARTLEQGLKILEHDLSHLQGSVISGEVVFKLYDTYGFPMDLTADIARERQLSIDEAGFDVCMEAQRQRSQKAGKFKVDYNAVLKVDADTLFLGYEDTQATGKIIALFMGDESVHHVNEGQAAVVVLDQTAFYAESGGQVGDSGTLTIGHTRFEVRDTTKVGGAFLHQGIVTQGQLVLNDSVLGQVDATIRTNTARNHSATHLLHAALRQTLGTHVQQKGSLVCADYLRFDFSHPEGLTATQLFDIESLVNRQILANTAVCTEVTDIDTAKTKGAMALFGEKYGDTVRVLSMGEDNFSVELCGGTHVKRTGDIGLLKITSEGGVAAGVRRIEAKTAAGALAWFYESEQMLSNITQLVKGQRQTTADKVQQLTERNRDLEKEIDKLTAKLAANASNELLAQVQTVDGGIPLLATQLAGADAKSLRSTFEQVKSKLSSGIIVLAIADEQKATVIAGVTSDLTARFKAGDLVQYISLQLSGKGGGRPDVAQGGGSNVAALPQALRSISLWLQQK